MGRKSLVGLAAWLIGAHVLLAQSAAWPPWVTENDAGGQPALGDSSAAALPNGSRMWMTAGYLIWWIKDGPLHTPLVTTSTDTPLTVQSGQIGQPGTQVLFGESNLRYGTFFGGSASVGGWLDGGRNFGIETGGFVLERRSVGFRVNADSAGVPLLVIPFQSPTGKESGVIVAIPAVGPVVPMVGGITVTSASRLWSAEANGVLPVWRQSWLSTEMVAGVRYADLDESLNIASSSGFDIPALGATTMAQMDTFDTRNQFLGGQIGSRVVCTLGRLSMDALGTIALGDTHQVVNVAGLSTASGAMLPGASLANAGIFAQSSNSGQFSRDQFTVIPELQLKIGYGWTSSLRTSVSYSVLYWSSVARPGDQIDRVINISQNAVLSGPGGPSGPARPAPQTNSSELLAHGVSFGMEWDW